MMDFEYHEPATLAEASKLLARYKGEARVLAGGTDLIPRMRRKLVRPKALINIKKVPGLDKITYRKGKGLTIGPLVTFDELIGSKVVARRFPILVETFNKIATPQVRNLATLAGNLGNAAPSADSAPILIAMDAKVTLYCPRGRTRTIPVEQLFTGPGSIACGPGELIRAIIVPDIPPRTGLSYIKHKTREALEIAVVGVAVMVRVSKKGPQTCEDARIVVGACAPVPLRTKEAEAHLVGSAVTADAIARAARAASEAIRPITDVRGSIEYRRDMTEFRTKEALHEAISKVTSLSLPEVV
jgi:carbon-monoxide dehydrogenase medium subunit